MPATRPFALFAAGAALATALTITGIQAFNVGAAPGDVDTTFVPVEPCRLFDTRAAATQGDRRAPLGAGETYSAQVTGDNGDCVGLPSDASAVALNVTSIGPTAQSFLTVFPADVATPPEVSNLNWVAGQAPTPNKVDVKLSPDGKAKFSNSAGTVNIAVDVVGYYTSSSLVEIESRLAALETRNAELASEIRDAKASTLTRKFSDQQITADWTSVASYTNINLSRRGTVIVFASGTAVEFEGGADVQCVITDRTSGFSGDDNMRWEAAGTTDSNVGEGDASNIAGMESFDVDAGTGSYYLYCRNLDADVDAISEIWDPEMTILFFPDR